MSQTHPTAASSSSSNFQLIINNALNTYKQRTKNDLGAHPLATQLQSCDSPSAILTVLHEQVHGLEQPRSSDERWTKWLDPTVNVLYAFSGILGSGVSLVCLRTCTCPSSLSDMHMVAILTGERDLCRSRHPPFGVYPY